MPCSNNRENELWQQCIKWIKSTGVLSTEAEFDKLSDFAFILRDGILLCNLAIKLCPNCIYSHEILSQYQQSHVFLNLNFGGFLGVGLSVRIWNLNRARGLFWPV